ncbi:MAG: Ser-Thr-rich GPI-anchored membrane family protein [Syntrophobacteraceae bacterium]
MRSRFTAITNFLRAAGMFLCLALSLFLAAHASAGAVTYTYDDQNRLIEEIYSNGTVINYSYDSSGNRISREVLSSSGAITLISPNGGEQWKPGTTETIYWTYKGTAGAKVKIELFKGGALKSTLAASTSIGTGGSGSLDWAIPASQTAGADYKIKISSTGSSAISDTSRSNFTIESAPAFVITAPAGGEKWMRGDSRTISWTYTGDPGSSVRIDLLKGGRVLSNVTRNAPVGANGSGSFSWTIPESQAPGSDYQLRIATSTGERASTGNAFSITGGISVSYPYSGDSWAAGSVHSLKWSYDGNPGPRVKIELLKGGVVNTTISESTPIGIDGSGSYEWLIKTGQAPGTDYSIRITSRSDSACTGVSRNNFTIVSPGFTISSPSYWSSSWPAGTTQKISWDYVGDPGPSVNIDLLKGGQVSQTIAAGASKGNDGSGSYYWTVPGGQTPGTDYGIRITSTSNSAFKGESEDSFTIVAPGITVTSPSSGETWTSGAVHTINWRYTGNPGALVKIELLKGGAAATISAAAPIGDGGYGSYSWLIPASQAAGTGYTLRVTSTSNPAGSGVSQSFSISPPDTIAVTSPVGGESWIAGAAKTIRWSYTGDPGSTVTVELLKAGSLSSTVATNVSIANRSCAWTIPGATTPGTDYRIRVRTNQYYSAGSNDFSITNSSVLTLVSPNGGESLPAGLATTVKWTYAGSPGSTVKIELLKDGVFKSVISSGTPVGTGGSGSFSWPIPAAQTEGSYYQIRITCGSYSDTSQGYFSIKSSLIEVDYPYEYQTWDAGIAKPISWYYYGNPGSSVKIELLKAGVLKTTIAASTPIGSNGWGEYYWLIPAGQAPGSDYTVRVTSTSNSAFKDLSDTFTIAAPAITVAYPYSGEDWFAGTIQEITWSYSGDPGTSVKVELLKEGAVNATIAESTPIGSNGNGSCYWLIPSGQAPGSDYAVRVTSKSNSAYSDISSDTFNIAAPSIEIYSPYGADWKRNSTHTITWYYTGNPGPAVKVELLKGGALKSTITAGTPIGNEGSGYFHWQIPANQELGTDYNIRLTSTTNANCSAVCEIPFTIESPTISVVSPESGDNWKVDSTRVISWRWDGNAGSTVRVELLSGETIIATIAESISAGINGSGELKWPIPAGLAPDNDYKIRVTSTSNGISGVSGSFSIAPATITVTSPRGGEWWQSGTARTINWSYNGEYGASVRIYLLKGGSYNHTVADSTSIGTNGSGTYLWNIPSDLESGPDYTVQVTSTSSSDYWGESRNSFTILPHMETGSLTATITPIEAITAGAKWGVDNGDWLNSGETVAAPVYGSRSVLFKDIPGWDTPEVQTVTVSEGGTTTAAGEYVRQIGSLTVSITPQAAVEAGAMWQVDGGGWMASGDTVQNLPAGPHVVSCKVITGWISPSSRTVTISKDDTATVACAYRKPGGSIHQIINLLLE